MKMTRIALCIFTLLSLQPSDAFTTTRTLSSSTMTPKSKASHRASTQLSYRQSEHHDVEHQIDTNPKIRKPKNRVYKHSFRHYGDVSFDSWLRCEEPEAFLRSIGYTQEEFHELVEEYPPLLTLNVHDQLAPKARFLVETLGAGTGRLAWNPEQDLKMTFSEDEECPMKNDSFADAAIPHSLRLSDTIKQNLPASFFGCSLDREVGPYHAYLQHAGLLHGPELLADPSKFLEFLIASKSMETFSALCQQWSGEKEPASQHSKESIASFLDTVTQGLLPIAKKEASYYVDLLLEHGYNPLESDATTGVGPLHWLAGRGKLAGTQALVHALEEEHDCQSLLELLDDTREPKMGATPFHWAASGMSPSLQGSGGSLELCDWMMDRVYEEGGKDALIKLCNLPCSTDQSTPLMYAAWGGNWKVCQWLVHEGGADPLCTNENGQNPLHWAAAAGHLEVCQFLAEEGYRELQWRASSATEGDDDVGLEAPRKDGQLLEQDKRGLAPLDYAKQYDRDDVIEWMTQVL